MLYIKNIKSKGIYPFTQELWDTGCFEAYESSLTEDEEVIEVLSEDEDLYEQIKHYPRNLLSKDTIEEILDKRISNQVFNKAMKRLG